MVQTSLFITFIDGDIAEFGGVRIVLSLTLVEFESTTLALELMLVLILVFVLVLRVVESVVITSVCAKANVDITKSTRNAVFLIIYSSCSLLLYL